jgi:Uma2 family endonuclease
MATVISPPEQKVILHNVSWETYERLLADLQGSSAPRLTFDRGVLEIMSPSAEHEEANRTVALLVEEIAMELGIDVRGFGSATFRRGDLEQGFEPDSCFYIQNEARMRGKKRIDLAADPPPDLVIEIDITSPSVAKLPIFAQVGVPEVWRYDGSNLVFLKLTGAAYAATNESTALPGVTSGDIIRFLEQNEFEQRTIWLKGVREWARTLRRS